MLAGLPITLLSLISSCNKNKEGSLQQAITGCSANYKPNLPEVHQKNSCQGSDHVRMTQEHEISYPLGPFPA